VSKLVLNFDLTKIQKLSVFKTNKSHFTWVIFSIFGLFLITLKEITGKIENVYNLLKERTTGQYYPTISFIHKKVFTDKLKYKKL